MKEVDEEQVTNDPDTMKFILSGYWSVHSGKSSSLHAPSGPVLQEMVLGAIRLAEISPLDIDYCVCHGEGTPLNDAIEYTSLCRALREKLGGEETLAIGAAKTNVANGKHSAGIA